MSRRDFIAGYIAGYRRKTADFFYKGEWWERPDGVCEWEGTDFTATYEIVGNKCVIGIAWGAGQHDEIEISADDARFSYIAEQVYLLAQSNGLVA